MPDGLYKLIAFAGYARSGKDEAAKGLIALGYSRKAFGDHIKRRLRDACPCHLKVVLDWMSENEPFDSAVRDGVRAGFLAIRQGRIDPFTEDDAQKQYLRPVLERYGEAYYDPILEDYKAELTGNVVNTRMVRTREGEAWRAMGGIIIEITRPGVGPATDWERDRLQEVRDAGLIRAVVINDADRQALCQRVLETCRV